MTNLKTCCRRTLPVAAAVLAALGIAASAQAHRVDGANADDLALARQVQAELLRAPALQDPVTELNITVNQGRVLIAGWVAHADDEGLARRLATAVPGVRRVGSTLRAWSTEYDPGLNLSTSATAVPGVLPALRVARDVQGPADRELGRRVVRALSQAPALHDPDTDLQVHVDAGRVRMSGWVDSADDVAAARAAAQAVPGVVAVGTDLRLWSTSAHLPRPDAGMAVPPAQRVVGATPEDVALGQQVRSALLQTPAFHEHAADVRVSVQGGKVALSGWVTYTDDVDSARRTAAAQPGVQTVSTSFRTWTSETRP